MAEYQKKLEVARLMLRDIGHPFCEFYYFLKTYPFITENFAGCVPLFDFKDKSFLTVGSSGDQVINAAYFGSVDQTVIDINPFTEFYFYLKKAGLQALTRQEFMDYFCYRSYLPKCVNNPNVFNLDSFEKMQPLLKDFDSDSYAFWSELFNQYSTREIRENIFSMDEDQSQVIMQMNPYLKSDKAYLATRAAIKDLTPKFIEGNIYEYNDFESYDNIHLSNLAQYKIKDEAGAIEYKSFVEKMESHLNLNGTMLIAYIFNFDTFFPDCNETYDEYLLLEVFIHYTNDFITLSSSTDFLLQNNCDPDSVLVYRKMIK